MRKNWIRFLCIGLMSILFPDLAQAQSTETADIKTALPVEVKVSIHCLNNRHFCVHRCSQVGRHENRLDLEHALARVLSRANLPRERRGKSYDLRPLIESLILEPEDRNTGGTVLLMQLAARAGATGRPDEVLRALGVDSAGARACRSGWVSSRCAIRASTSSTTSSRCDRAVGTACRSGRWRSRGATVSSSSASTSSTARRTSRSTSS